VTRVRLASALAVALLAAAVWAARPADAATKRIAVFDASYNPASFTVTAGDTVRWTNSSQSQHSVTSDSGAFDSHPQCGGGGACLATGEAYERVFPTVGSFGYHCKVHPEMIGTVTVNAPTEPTTTTTTTTIATTTTRPRPPLGTVVGDGTPATTTTTTSGGTAATTSTTPPAGPSTTATTLAAVGGASVGSTTTEPPLATSTSLPAEAAAVISVDRAAGRATARTVALVAVLASGVGLAVLGAVLLRGRRRRSPG
jgi:plastocyanin